MAAWIGVGTSPGVFAHRQQFGDQGRVPGDEAGPITGQRRALRQRVDREQPGVVSPADLGMQHRHRSGGSTSHPSPVALVGRDHPPSRAHSTTLRRWSTPSTRPVGSLHSGRPAPATGAPPGSASPRAAPGPGQPGPDVIGRVGQLGHHDEIRGPQADRVGSQAMSSLLPITGSTAASVSPSTPKRRPSAATADSRRRAVPAVAGYPEAEPTAPARPGSAARPGRPGCRRTGRRFRRDGHRQRLRVGQGVPRKVRQRRRHSPARGWGYLPLAGRAPAGRSLPASCSTGPLSRLRPAVADP